MNQINIENLNYLNFWYDNEISKKEYICQTPSDELINKVELKLGYKLPESYKWLMKQHNGGILNKNEYNKEELEYWNNKIELAGIYGIAEEEKYNTILNNLAINNNMLNNIGVAFCDTESGGHDIIFFDYRECGPQGEPKISYIDFENLKITIIANDFTEFINKIMNDNKNKNLIITNNDFKEEQINIVNNKLLKKIKIYTIICFILSIINIIFIFPNVLSGELYYIIFSLAILILPLYGFITNIILVSDNCKVKNKMKRIKIISNIIGYMLILTSLFYISDFLETNLIMFLINIAMAILYLLKTNNIDNNSKMKKITSISIARDEYQKGNLEYIYIISPLFGGAENGSNILYVPKGIAKIKEQYDNMIADLVKAGEIKSYDLIPEYKERSCIPYSITIKAGKEEINLLTIKINIW